MCCACDHCDHFDIRNINAAVGLQRFFHRLKKIDIFLDFSDI